MTHHRGNGTRGSGGGRAWGPAHLAGLLASGLSAGQLWRGHIDIMNFRFLITFKANEE